MKLRSFFLLLFILFVAFDVHSQVALTAADLNPQPGDVFIEHSGTISQLNLSSLAAKVGDATWDLSSIIFPFQDTFAYVSCNDAPACGFFPGANIVEIGIIHENSYYSSSDSAGLVYLGTIVPGWDPSDTAFAITQSANHPLIYGNTYVDSSSGMQIHYENSYNYFEKTYYSIHGTTIYDGLGKLILPIGTFENVLRAHVVSDEISSVTAYFFDGSHIYDSEVVQVYKTHIDNYVWYAKDFHAILASVGFTIDSSYKDSSLVYLTNYFQAIYTETLPVTTVHPGISDFAYYPNPVSSHFTVLFRISEPQLLRVEITDLLGRRINTLTEQQFAAGSHNLYYDHLKMPHGIYLFNIRGKDINLTRKLEFR